MLFTYLFSHEIILWTLCFSEAWRVLEFCASCERGDSVEVLGSLMAASHASLRDLYEASHPELDRLVTIAPHLAHGARLTGAG